MKAGFVVKFWSDITYRSAAVDRVHQYDKGGTVMNENRVKRNELLAQKVIRGLESRNMTGYHVHTKEEALKKALELIPEGSSIAHGGCASIEEIGLVDKIKNGNYKYIDRYAAADKRAAELEAYGADVYLGSVNAMTDDGILVNIDGNYYYLDATWGDAGYISDPNDNDLLPGGISYHFLNVTTEEMNRTHTLDNVMPMPYCIATDANYYVHEDEYLIGYQPSKLQTMFKNAADSGERFVTFKCSSRAVYNMCVMKLLDKQEIFNYLPSGSKAVDYFTDEDLLIISFWF